MSNVKPAAELRSPLYDFGLANMAMPVDDSRGVWANEVPANGFIGLRGSLADTAFAEAVEKVLPVPLPSQPCTISVANDTRILWLSPDEWMIVVPRVRHAALLKELTSALNGTRSQVADNSGGYTEVIVLGRDAANVLSHCTVYNLDGLKPGRIAGTTFGKASVYLARDGDGFRLLLRRSFADYIWRFLVRAAAPYKFGIGRLDGGDA